MFYFRKNITSTGHN